MDPIFFDCHVHSDFSDGDNPIETVFQEAKRANLKGIVVTDHNLTVQFKISQTLSKKYKINTLQGVEITCNFDGIDIHMLGYSDSFNVKQLNISLKRVQDGYTKRVRAILSKLSKLKVTNIKFNDLLNSKKSKVLFRYDLTKAIANEGKYQISEIQKLIGRNGPAYIPYGHWVFTPQEALDLIHQCGGIGIIGHPGESLKRSFESIEKTSLKVDLLIFNLIKQGLNGIEVYHSSHDTKLVNHYKEIAEKNNLIITGGSDFHGKIHHPEISIGSFGLNDIQWDKFTSQLKKTEPKAPEH